MTIDVTVHYDNHWSFANPHLWVWYPDAPGSDDVSPAGHDGFGPVFDFRPRAPRFHFMAKDGAGASPTSWEDDGLLVVLHDREPARRKSVPRGPAVRLRGGTATSGTDLRRKVPRRSPRGREPTCPPPTG